VLDVPRCAAPRHVKFVLSRAAWNIMAHQQPAQVLFGVACDEAGAKKALRLRWRRVLPNDWLCAIVAHFCLSVCNYCTISALLNGWSYDHFDIAKQL
jgi:hypothetical protein